MERDDQRHQTLELGDAVTEALVVVHEVELGQAVLEMGVDASAERERLGEHAAQELGGLEQLVPGLELPDGGKTGGVMIIEQVEAGELGQLHPIVEHRVRLAAEHLDRVPELDQRLGEMARVDALTAHVGLAAIREIRKRQGRVRVEPGRFRHPDRLPAVDYR